MIGVFGGSGFYEFLEGATPVEVDTPYGAPSAPYMVGTVDGVEVAFLPRHGAEHQFPPHRVPFRANAWGMKELGVTCVIGPCAAGSLDPSFAPGHFVVCDQLVDWTSGRERSFSDGPDVEHLAFADPYCPELRSLAVDALRGVGATVHDGGTVVVIQGPRFSTRAESKFYASQGWGVINMTQEPEVALCRELDMCYVNISVITDYDVGVEGEHEPVTHEAVLRQFDASLGTLRAAVRRLIPAVAVAEPCRTGPAAK
jgi:5'-methylthioadenosine phosphorylase